MKPRYSIILPIYKDAELAEAFCQDAERTFRSYLKKDDVSGELEIIFIEDGTGDKGQEKILRELAEKHAFVRVLVLSRNFGQHIAVSCGYRHAQGDYVCMANVDQQEPVEQLPSMIDYMNEHGCDLVQGLRKQYNASWPVQLTSRAFNFVMNKLTRTDLPLNAGTTRVMSRRFTDAYNSFAEKSRYIPGLEMWLGFNVGYIPVNHFPRTIGQSSYNFRKRLYMAMNSIISFSDLPLKWVVYFGSILAISGLALAGYLIFSKFFFIDYSPGYTSTMAAIVLIGGTQILVTGLAAIYIGRILTEVQNRPLYVIKEHWNCEARGPAR